MKNAGKNIALIIFTEYLLILKISHLSQNEKEKEKKYMNYLRLGGLIK